ncbi:hypothetical protein DVH24_035400 [Malus domestica]|uniref:RNase H type-1 domain-containing protein n=1 Tax=Malus domestica TaxID=3750 RepID=A0A498J614_MALDO|nr:hypothetical protein DVH24_035400 [Malus domestica]
MGCVDSMSSLEVRGLVETTKKSTRINETRRGGFGWVARDFAGIFKGAGGVGNICCESSFMAEAEAVRAALVACVERGFGFVQIETDSKVLVDILTCVSLPEAAMEGVLWDIHHLKLQLCSVKFLFTPCSCNGVAHLVTTHVTRVGGCHMWDYFEPEWLFNALAFDVNISIRI